MHQKILPLLALASIGVIFVGGLYLIQRRLASASPYPPLSAKMSTDALRARFDYLSQQGTNSCGGGKEYVAWLSSDGQRIQGSCCSAMSFHSYQEQVEGLQAFSQYDSIPPDPYDVPAEWADAMMEYGAQTELTAEQQAIYDEAVTLSHEEGPCCCKCWHWYAYEGLAMHLITNQDFSAEQVAAVWDLSDACGGDHSHHG